MSEFDASDEKSRAMHQLLIEFYSVTNFIKESEGDLYVARSNLRSAQQALVELRDRLRDIDQAIQDLR